MSGVESEGGRVHIVGTAHVSAESAERVEETIRSVSPDVVAVELDDARYRQLKGETPEDIDPKDLLSGATVFQFLAYWLLSYVQARLGDRFDITPGADMQAGIETGEEVGAEVALVDRDIQTTVQRFWRRMTIREKLRLVWELVKAMVGLGEADEDFDVEDLTDQDVITAMLEEFRQFSPGGAEALIDERDAYIAYNLLDLQAGGNDVVAVVGAGHAEGIERYLVDPSGLPPMETLTGNITRRRFSLVRVASYGITAAFVGFFVLLAMAGIRSGFLAKLFLAWFLFNGVFAFGLAKLAGAHWTSATVGGLVAWLTSVNPLLAPGWFAGYVELRQRPVSMGDINTLNDIMADEERPIRTLVGEMLQVPLFRLISVVALTNVGSFIATALFPLVVLPWMAPEIGGVSGIADAMVRGAQNSADLLFGGR